MSARAKSIRIYAGSLTGRIFATAFYKARPDGPGFVSDRKDDVTAEACAAVADHLRACPACADCGLLRADADRAQFDKATRLNTLFREERQRIYALVTAENAIDVKAQIRRLLEQSEDRS